ncbi:uncharacterized protein LOC126767365 [Bactrocera neohumeralis]|uniref:uncharacterized protein LOC126767365 n=1 Tax=Bactrocera neohumeralis TaxID=98809 RepID=UPI002166B797|nr:uncharacterized protein LOC126767365 [Bactrocera neohumeralis]
MRGSRYEFLESVGEGNYGALYRGVARGARWPRNAIIAGKKVKQAGSSRNVLRELSIQRCVASSPYVVALHNVVPRDEEKVLLILEFLPMNLREFMNSFGCSHRQQAVQELRELLVPLSYTRDRF